MRDLIIDFYGIEMIDYSIFRPIKIVKIYSSYLFGDLNICTATEPWNHGS